MPASLVINAQPCPSLSIQPRSGCCAPHLLHNSISLQLCCDRGQALASDLLYPVSRSIPFLAYDIPQTKLCSHGDRRDMLRPCVASQLRSFHTRPSVRAQGAAAVAEGVRQWMPSHPPSQASISDTEIARLASKPRRPLTLADLVKCARLLLQRTWTNLT
jgi:hypothetical protein